MLELRNCVSALKSTLNHDCLYRWSSNAPCYSVTEDLSMDSSSVGSQNWTDRIFLRNEILDVSDYFFFKKIIALRCRQDMLWKMILKIIDNLQVRSSAHIVEYECHHLSVSLLWTPWPSDHFLHTTQTSKGTGSTRYWRESSIWLGVRISAGSAFDVYIRIISVLQWTSDTNGFQCHITELQNRSLWGKILTIFCGK